MHAMACRAGQSDMTRPGVAAQFVGGSLTRLDHAHQAPAGGKALRLAEPPLRQFVEQIGGHRRRLELQHQGGQVVEVLHRELQSALLMVGRQAHADPQFGLELVARLAELAGAASAASA